MFARFLFYSYPDNLHIFFSYDHSIEFKNYSYLSFINCRALNMHVWSPPEREYLLGSVSVIIVIDFIHIFKLWIGVFVRDWRKLQLSHEKCDKKTQKFPSCGRAQWRNGVKNIIFHVSHKIGKKKIEFLTLFSGGAQRVSNSPTCLVQSIYIR